MSKTSLKDYTVAGLTGALVITVFVIAFAIADTNYDISDIDESTFNTYGNISEMSGYVQNATEKIDTIGTDTGLFDVVGALISASIEGIKSVFNGIKFLTTNVGSMLSFLGINPVFITYITSVILVSIFLVLLFRYINKSEDEK